MPQYELMYLLGSHVADSEVPAISAQVLKAIEDFGGGEIKETLLGKKKLAYPIKKTRNGHYVAVNFTLDSGKINQLDGKIRSMNANIIRYLIVNLDEHLRRLSKDKTAQAKMKPRIMPPLEAPVSKTGFAAKTKASAPALEIDSAELDKKIEEALAEDLTK